MLIASALLAVLAAAGICAWRDGWMPGIVPPNDNAYVGMTREQIIARLGPPDDQSPGNYGLPDANWAKQFEPCQTLSYVKWNGTLYISVYQKDGRWVCYCSNWLPKGAAY
jgi:hypothetical protein